MGYTEKVVHSTKTNKATRYRLMKCTNTLQKHILYSD